MSAPRQAVVVQPDEGPSFWLPVSGHADPKLTPDLTGFDGLSMGYETVPAGRRIPEHAHPYQVHKQICFSGEGRVIVDGTAHKLVPGTACFLGYDVKHEIINDFTSDLVMLWVIAPAGLEKLYERVGKPRQR